MNHAAEKQRLIENASPPHKWKCWGPYLSERQWGTVREDYSAGGDAWDHLTHEHSRSRAYRWGEDGIAGISDDWQHLCLALAMWNGKDPILKERIFGLTNGQGNHGEDAKELYYYLDATPTHSYLKMLYKYPQREFPYAQLLEENRRRGKNDPEFELLDTGIFDDDRYFDVFVEYAKASPEDILMRVTVHNRGPEEATIHLLPQLWFRNTWSWKKDSVRPEVFEVSQQIIAAKHAELGEYQLHCDGDAKFLFCDNETNTPKLYGSKQEGFFKDGFHECVVGGNKKAVNPWKRGTKAAAHYQLAIPPNGAKRICLRLQFSAATEAAKEMNFHTVLMRKSAAKSFQVSEQANPFSDFDNIFQERIREADEFYADLQHDIPDEDARNVQRQAFAGMIWSKQFFYYDVTDWLNGDPAQPKPPAERRHGRNSEWTHLNNADIISMPDKWEYPWYAAWDLAFHAIPLAMIDTHFAKRQLDLLTREWYMHPNGQLPAYEWNFGDVNPPVHAWATWRVFQIDRKQRRDSNPGDKGDLAFLERVFHKLMLNFTWWVNRKDASGKNIFQGGFLGLDNIGVFDRSSPLPTGGFISQADGTSWMAMYSLNLMRIALELAMNNRVYEDIATKFFEHFLRIAAAINGVGEETLSLWDEKDEFYYDALHLPNNHSCLMKVRSMVGLIPLFAVQVLEQDIFDKLPEFTGRLRWFLNYRPELANLISRWQDTGKGERHLLSLLRGHRMKALLRRVLDETEFLSDYGVRALSKVHEAEPYRFQTNGTTLEVAYSPAESRSSLFGGNSNWRGPIWMPVNYLIIESLQKFHHYYGDDFKVECPTGSKRFLTLKETADEISHRLSKIFLKDENGVRPVLRYHEKLATDPHFRDYILFHEYFHGDNGCGLGASHQTGWTGLVAKMIQPRPYSEKSGEAKAQAKSRASKPALAK